MKNLFFVVNKEKIYAYAVSITTVVVIFFASSIINSKESDAKPVSSNIFDDSIVEENEININIDVKETSGIIGDAIFTSSPFNENFGVEDKEDDESGENDGDIEY